MFNIKAQFSRLNIYWDGCISLGPQRRGCQGRIKCARILLGEVLVREKIGSKVGKAGGAVRLQCKPDPG